MVRSYMVNENVPLAKEKPFWMEYEKQKESDSIKEWIRPRFDEIVKDLSMIWE